MTVFTPRLTVIGGSASTALAQEICAHLGMELTQSEVRRFSDGELFVKIDSNVRGADVYLVQSTCTPVNDRLMELFMLIDAARRASAARITCVIPYFGYARQDRKDQGRVALSARLVANLLTRAGCDRVVTLDLHSAQIQGFFDIPVDHLYAAPLIADHVRAMNLHNAVVVSPDVGNVKMARNYADALGLPLAIVDKRRPRPNECEVMAIIGEIKDHNCILFDDMIDTAGTITQAAAALKSRGALDVYACCTHPVLSGPAISRIMASPIKKLVVTNTIPPREDWDPNRIHVLNIAPFVAEAMRRIHNNESVSSLFETITHRRKS